MTQKVTILGARGSVPVSGNQFTQYGCATTCVLVQLCGQNIVLDAGTGLFNLPHSIQTQDHELPILLSHPHADHLLGLPLFPRAFDPEALICIYSARRKGLDGLDQLRALMSPPLWPVGPEQLPAEFYFIPLTETQLFGEVTVDTMEGVHPGGVTLMRLRGGGKQVVYVTDCTLTEPLLSRLIPFAKDCDLLLCDGQYAPEQWPARSRFGHSTWEMAAQLGVACAAKRVRVIHHDPAHTDRMLHDAQAQLTAIHPDCRFGFEGEEILL